MKGNLCIRCKNNFGDKSNLNAKSVVRCKYNFPDDCRKFKLDKNIVRVKK